MIGCSPARLAAAHARAVGYPHGIIGSGTARGYFDGRPVQMEPGGGASGRRRSIRVCAAPVEQRARPTRGGAATGTTYTSSRHWQRQVRCGTSARPVCSGAGERRRGSRVGLPARRLVRVEAASAPARLPAAWGPGLAEILVDRRVVEAASRWFPVEEPPDLRPLSRAGADTVSVCGMWPGTSRSQRSGSARGRHPTAQGLDVRNPGAVVRDRGAACEEETPPQQPGSGSRRQSEQRPYRPGAGGPTAEPQPPTPAQIPLPSRASSRSTVTRQALRRPATRIARAGAGGAGRSDVAEERPAPLSGPGGAGRRTTRTDPAAAIHATRPATGPTGPDGRRTHVSTTRCG